MAPEYCPLAVVDGSAMDGIDCWRTFLLDVLKDCRYFLYLLLSSQCVRPTESSIYTAISIVWQHGRTIHRARGWLFLVARTSHGAGSQFRQDDNELHSEACQSFILDVWFRI
jgi:hypothetical protein